MTKFLLPALDITQSRKLKIKSADYLRALVNYEVSFSYISTQEDVASLLDKTPGYVKVYLTEAEALNIHKVLAKAWVKSWQINRWVLFVLGVLIGSYLTIQLGDMKW